MNIDFNNMIRKDMRIDFGWVGESFRLELILHLILIDYQQGIFHLHSEDYRYGQLPIDTVMGL